MTDIDLRSYFPKFERKLTWADGAEYRVREIEDLSEGEFDSMLDEEQRFNSMTFVERKGVLKRHLASLVIVPTSTVVRAAKGERNFVIDGTGSLDYVAGDTVYVSGGLYVERNVITGVSDDRRVFTVESAWKYGANSSARIFRSVREEDIAALSQKQFMIAVNSAKSPTSAEDTADPQAAASGSTS